MKKEQPKEPIVSEVGQLEIHDWKKVLMGAFISSIGVGATMLLDYLKAIDLSQYDFSMALGISMAISILANLLRKLVTENQYPAD